MTFTEGKKFMLLVTSQSTKNVHEVIASGVVESALFILAQTRYTSGSQPLLWESYVAPKHPLCCAQQSFNKTSNRLCNRLHFAIKQTRQLACVKIYFIRLSKKIVGLDLDPFSEKAESNSLHAHYAKNNIPFFELGLRSRRFLGGVGVGFLTTLRVVVGCPIGSFLTSHS